MKIVFEVDQAKLFDIVAQHGTESVISDIIGHMMTGKSGFGSRVRLEVYGIDPIEEPEMICHENAQLIPSAPLNQCSEQANACEQDEGA